MNKGHVMGSFRTTLNNISSLDDERFSEMVEAVKAEKIRRKPVKAACSMKKRGRPALYETAEERKQAIDTKRREKLALRNATLEEAGLPIPRRGRPRKTLD